MRPVSAAKENPAAVETARGEVVNEENQATGVHPARYPYRKGERVSPAGCAAKKAPR